MNSMSVVVCGWEKGLWERGGVDVCGNVGVGGEVGCGRGWVEDVCGGYGRKWAMRDNEVGKREWDFFSSDGLVPVTGWAPALAGLSTVRINVIKRMCPSCFSFPYLPTCHSESFPITRKHRALSYTATQYWVSQPLELWAWVTLLVCEWSTLKFSVMGQRRGWDHFQPHPSSETLIALPVTVQSGFPASLRRQLLILGI